MMACATMAETELATLIVRWEQIAMTVELAMGACARMSVFMHMMGCVMMEVKELAMQTVL